MSLSQTRDHGLRASRYIGVNKKYVQLWKPEFKYVHYFSSLRSLTNNAVPVSNANLPIFSSCPAWNCTNPPKITLCFLW